MGILKTISKIGIAPAVGAGNLITAGLSKITGKEYGRTTISQAVETKTGQILGAATAAVAAAAIGAYTVTTPAALAIAKTTAKAITPATTKGKIIAAVATPVVIGAVTAQPKETAKTIIAAPSNLANVGANIANLAAAPSLEKAEELVKENPVIIGTALTAATAIGVKGVVQAAATYGQTQAIKAQTSAIENQSSLPTATTIAKAQAAPEIMAASKAPVLAETQVLTATSGTTRKKKRSKPLPREIKQQVGISIINNNKSYSAGRTTKKYINEIALRN